MNIANTLWYRSKNKTFLWRYHDEKKIQNYGYKSFSSRYKTIEFIHFQDVNYFILPPILRAFPETLKKYRDYFIFEYANKSEISDPPDPPPVFDVIGKSKWIHLKIVLKNKEKYNIAIDTIEDLLLVLETFHKFKE